MQEHMDTPNFTFNITYNCSKMKHLVTNLTKHGWDLWDTNYKTLMMEIIDLKKWKDISCSRIGRLNTVKMQILPRFIYKFNVITIKFPARIFVDIHKIIWKFIWKGKGTRIAKAIMKKSKRIISLPDFKLQCSRLCDISKGI